MKEKKQKTSISIQFCFMLFNVILDIIVFYLIYVSID
jgi:hypothetical protein